MNKTELITQVQKNLGKESTKAAAERALGAVLEAVTNGIKVSAKKVKSTNSYENAVQLPGFGTFKVSWRAAREGRNPSTGKKIKIKASRVVNFKAGSSLKDSVK